MRLTLVLSDAVVMTARKPGIDTAHRRYLGTVLNRRNFFPAYWR